MTDADPTPGEIEAHRDDGYRALGRYMAEFSQMIMTMRRLMVHRLQRPGDHPLLAELPFGGATAQSVLDAFFGMCRMTIEHDDDEAGTAKKLYNAVREEIQLRNDFAHGDWYIGYWSRTGEDPAMPNPPWAEKVKPIRKEGPLALIKKDLDERTDEIGRLAALLDEYGRVCLHLSVVAEREDLRVRDVLAADGKRPIPGPRARHPSLMRQQGT
jgi:hypothetical protein